MNKFILSFCLLAGIAVTPLLSGCSSQPSAADLMRGHGADSEARAALKKQLASDWDKGAKLVAAGEKQVKNGEKKVKSGESDVKSGRADMDAGNRSIAEGRKLIQESETRFHTEFPDLKLTPGK
jgi:hypothetical protein